MSSRITSAVIAAVALQLLAAGAAVAQVQGRVTGPADEPLWSAIVELWSPTARLAARQADSAGRFTFSAGESRGASALFVRRIGYSAARVPLPFDSATVDVTLKPLAVELAAVKVTDNSRRVCPNRESPAARALWNSVRRRYGTGYGLSREARSATWSGEVDADELGRIDRTRAMRFADRRITAYGLRGYRLGAAAGDYVGRLAGEHTDPDYGIWGYASAYSDFAQLFTEPAFGASHTFSLLPDSGSDSEIVLVYCPRDRRRSGLEGTLRIAADSSSFLSAWWTFWNPARDAEQAGGAVTFPPHGDASARPILVAATGLFWRRLGNGRYYEHWNIYQPWTLAANDSLTGAPIR